MSRRQKTLAHLREELGTIALFDRVHDYATNPDPADNRAYELRQIRRSQIMAEISTLSCAPQKPRTTSGDTLFQLVFMMQTAQDVLNCDPTIARQSMSRVQLRKV
jgi:hypothetical protein